MQVIEALDGEGRLALFACCHELRQAVLGAAPVVHLRLKVWDPAADSQPLLESTPLQAATGACQAVAVGSDLPCNGTTRRNWRQNSAAEELGSHAQGQEQASWHAALACTVT
jgi:hypothetical protein